MKKKRPDFGYHHVKSPNGTDLVCRYIAPGLTLHDLVMINSAAVAEAAPGDQFAGNPSKWPEVRGVRAVTLALLDAIYEDEEK